MTSRRRSREADPAENGEVVEVEIKEDGDADIPSDDENSGRCFYTNKYIVQIIGATKYFERRLMQTKGHIFRSKI